MKICNISTNRVSKNPLQFIPDFCGYAQILPSDMKGIEYFFFIWNNVMMKKNGIQKRSFILFETDGFGPRLFNKM